MNNFCTCRFVDFPLRLVSPRRRRFCRGRGGYPSTISHAIRFSGKLEKVILDSVNTEGDAASSSVGLGILLDGVNAITENLPVLVCLLDTLAKVHPFLEGTSIPYVLIPVKRH